MGLKAVVGVRTQLAPPSGPVLNDPLPQLVERTVNWISLSLNLPCAIA